MNPEHLLLQPLRITSASSRSEHVITAEGELDMHAAPDLERALDADRVGPADVHLDLGGVTFIDCDGVRALLETTQRFAEEGRPFRIARARGQVARVLSITGVDAVLPLYDPPRSSLPRPFGIDFLAGSRT